MLHKHFISLLWFCSTLSLTPDDFLIEKLPGLEEPINFKQYAGPIHVGDNSEDEIHYFFWLVESQRNPKADPLCFWFEF